MAFMDKISQFRKLDFLWN